MRTPAVKVLELLLKERIAEYKAAQDASDGADGGSAAAASSALASSTTTDAGSSAEPAPERQLVGVVALAAQHLGRALQDAAASVRASACMCYSYLLPEDVSGVPVGRFGWRTTVLAWAVSNPSVCLCIWYRLAHKPRGWTCSRRQLRTCRHMSVQLHVEFGVPTPGSVLGRYNKQGAPSACHVCAPRSHHSALLCMRNGRLVHLRPVLRHYCWSVPRINH